MKLLFLDIDGVLNCHKKFENGYCGIEQHCVRNFNFLLQKEPTTKIVISSAWRYMVHCEEMTLKGLEYLLITHGINCYNRLHGVTRKDIEISKNKWEDREDQILSYIVMHKYPYVVLDDLKLNMERFVQVDGSSGLTLKDVDKAIGILND